MNRLTYSMWICESFREYMDLNFRHVKGTPYRPIRFWRNRMGPGDESLIASAAAKKIGDKMINAIELPATSMARLITLDTFLAWSRCARSGYSGAIGGTAVSCFSAASGKQ